MSKEIGILHKVGRGLEITLYVIGGGTVLFMMVYVVANALSRTLFNASFPASLEIVQFILMPGLACVGFIAATLAHRHVVADILYEYFPAIGRKWLVFGNIVLSGVTVVILTWFTGVYAIYAMDHNFKAGFTNIPSWPMYVLIPVSLLICAAMFAYQAWEQARSPLESEEKADLLTAEVAPLLERARVSGEAL